MLDSLFFYILKLVIKMYVFLNLNPLGLRHGDCVVRAIAKALDQTWEKTYVELCVEGFNFGDMPNSNAVWGAYLQSKGFKRHTLPDTCPNCFTIGDFCKEYPKGTYIVATGTHAACIIDGVLYDNWNSSGETVAYYFSKE